LANHPVYVLNIFFYIKPIDILFPIAILERFYFVSLNGRSLNRDHEKGFIFSFTVGNFRFRVMNVFIF